MPYGNPMCLNLSLIELLPNEIFTPITDYAVPGIRKMYAISNHGRIINTHSHRFLKPTLNTQTGYLQVVICLEGARVKAIRIHRTEMLCFCPISNPDDFQVNHKDGNKLNNWLGNFEWVTSSENIQHAFDNGLHENHYIPRGELHGNASLKDAQVHEICQLLLKGEYQMKQIAEMYNTTFHVIKDIKYGYSYKHITRQYGYIKASERNALNNQEQNFEQIQYY